MSEGERTDRLFDAVVGIASGLELRTTLLRILHAAVDLVEARYGVMAVLEPSGQSLAEFIHVGMDEHVAEIIGDLPLQGRGVLGHVIRHPEPLRLANIADHPSSVGFPPGHPAMHTFLGVPVRVRGEVFGNLYLTEKAGGVEFTEEDERILVALAAAAAVSIENARLYESVSDRERWQSALAELAQMGLAGGSAGALLAGISRAVRTLVDVPAAAIAIVDADGDLIVEHVSGDTSACPVAVGDALTDVWSSGRSVAVPMRGGEGLDGVVLLCSSSEVTLDASAIENVTSFLEQAGVIVLLARTRADRERLAVFEERDRIARDLHDLVIQRVFAAGVTLQRTLRDPSMSPEVKSRVEATIDTLDSTIAEIRGTIFALEDRGDDSLRSRLLAEVATSQVALGFAPHVRMSGPVDTGVSGDVADQVVAVVRETLTNVARHARAASATIELSVDSSQLVLTVTDDGVGIGEVSRRSGLANIAARAAEASGTCTVRPGPLVGTEVCWTVPLT